MNEFKDGRKVNSIYFANGPSINLADLSIKAMEISMEPGHMALIPFVKVEYKDGVVVMYSVTTAEGVEMALPDDPTEE